MTVVARARQPLRRDWPALRTGSRLQDVEEREAHRLLDLQITLQLDVSTRPEVVQVGPLLGEQAIPAGQPRGRKRSHNLVLDRRPRTQARPAVGDEFDDAQLFTRLQPRGDGHTGDIGGTYRLDDHLGWPLDAVVHRHPDAQAADPSVMDQEPESALCLVHFALERGRERGAHPRVLALVRQVLVGDQLRLHNDPHWSVNGLDLVADRHDGPLGERHHAHGRYLDRAPRRGGPADTAPQHTVAEVELPLVIVKLAVANVKGFVVNEDSQEFAVGHVDARLA